MSGTKLPATLSLDLDNQWAYMRVHGDAGWEKFPSYFDRVVPRILSTLRKRQLRITVFVVGQDAARAENRAALRTIAEAGHEIGNHSFHHQPSIADKPEAEVEAELAQAESAIADAAGHRPVGYRAPGFAISAATLSALQRRGYAYDASTFPTSLGPLARMYYRSTTSNGAGGAEQKNLYGGWREALRPLRPHRLPVPHEKLLEIPVTTFPGMRTPIHLTYLLFAMERSRKLALSYFRAAMWSCAAAKVPPSLLLHPLDFLGSDDVPELAFFPGMRIRGEEKTSFVGDVLDILCERFQPVPLHDFATLHASLAV